MEGEMGLYFSLSINLTMYTHLYTCLQSQPVVQSFVSSPLVPLYSFHSCFGTYYIASAPLQSKHCSPNDIYIYIYIYIYTCVYVCKCVCVWPFHVYHSTIYLDLLYIAKCNQQLEIYCFYWQILFSVYHISILQQNIHCTCIQITDTFMTSSRYTAILQLLVNFDCSHQEK